MVMPAEAKKDYLENADFILQILIDKLEASSASPGQSVIRGRVLRQFKGVRQLDPDEHIVIEVTTYNRGSMPPPGDCYSFVASLEISEFLEVYLYEDEPGKFRAINTESIPSPTSTPYYLNRYSVFLANQSSNEIEHESVESKEGFWKKLNRLLNR